MTSDLGPQTSDFRPHSLFAGRSPGSEVGRRRTVRSRPPRGMLAPTWKLAFNALPAGNGTRPPWTNPQDSAKAMWKTARSAANRTCCASSTTRRRRNSSSPRNWSEKVDVGPQTSDLRPRTSDLRPRTSDLRPQTSDLRPQTYPPGWPKSEVRGLTPRARLPGHSLSSSVRAIVSTERNEPNGNRLQWWQDGGPQYGDHAV